MLTSANANVIDNDIRPLSHLMISNAWLMASSRYSAMVSVTVNILYRLIHLFLIAILALTVLFLPLYAIWVGIVTMQLNERYGKEFDERYEWARVGVLELALQGWSCKAGAGTGTSGAGTGVADLGLQGWCLGWCLGYSAGALGFWGWCCRAGPGAAGLQLKLQGWCLVLGWTCGGGAGACVAGVG